MTLNGFIRKWSALTNVKVKRQNLITDFHFHKFATYYAKTSLGSTTQQQVVAVMVDEPCSYSASDLYAICLFPKMTMPCNRT